MWSIFQWCTYCLLRPIHRIITFRSSPITGLYSICVLEVLLNVDDACFKLFNMNSFMCLGYPTIEFLEK